MMINYNTNNSVIYKIYCKTLYCSDIYYGSTVNFINREYNHKSICNNIKDKRYNLKLYESIRANGGWHNWTMTVVEVYPCLNRSLLNIQEQKYINSEKHNVNTNRAHRSKEDLKEHMKIYNIAYNKQKYEKKITIKN